MAQVGVLDEKKYGRLLGKLRPRIIQNDDEFDRLASELESLDAIEDTRELDAEERELQALLAHLCTEYEDRTVEPPLIHSARGSEVPDGAECTTAGGLGGRLRLTRRRIASPDRKTGHQQGSRPASCRAVPFVG